MTIQEYLDRVEHDYCPECGSDRVRPQFPREQYLHWREYCKNCSWQGRLKERE